MPSPSHTAVENTLPVAPLPSNPRWGTGARAAAAAAASLSFGAAGAAVVASSSTSFGTGVADGVGLLIGLSLALIQGAQAADRRSRRFVLVGVLLVAFALGAHALSVPVLTGLLLGVGGGMIALAAAAWCNDALIGRAGGVTVGILSALAGALVGVTGPLAALALLSAAALAALVAPNAVRGPRTPVFAVPARPDLGTRPAVVPVLLVLVAAFAVNSFGIVAGLVITTALGLAAVAAALPRPRRTTSAPLAEQGRTYDRAVSVFDSSASPRPALAATVRSVDDVRAALEAAHARGLSVGMHSTGHAAMGLADLGGGALLKVAMDGPITVDPDRQLVRIPAGRAWGDVVPLAHRHGLAVPHGSSGHVGVVGYLTRGGLSAYGRRTGVAANWIESIELVTADGRLVVASRENEPDLFWALRGGGGGFGVVTSVTVRAFAPGEIVTGAAMWELDDAAAVADAWARWSTSAPSAITTSLRILTVPPLPGMPMRLARRPLLVIDGTAVDHDVSARDAAGELLARLRDVAAPRLDTWRVADSLEVPHTHMDPPFSPAHSSAHALLGTNDADDEAQARGVVSDFIAAAAHRDTGVGIAELRQLGGALSGSPADAGVVGHYRGAFGWLAIALHGKPGRQVADAAIDHQRSRIASWDTGYTAPTLASERARPARSFEATQVSRVDTARQAIDPDGLFRVDIAPGAHSRLS
jgi:FAD/FMN-containing dehydrogenase